MLHKITMPDAGQTTDQLVVTRWLKKVGDAVARGDSLLEVETDKAVVSVESFAQGKLLKRLVEEGDTAQAGSVIAWVGEEGDLVAELVGARSAAPTPQAATPPPRSVPAGGLSASREPGSRADDRPRASPAAKKVARELGIDLQEVARTTGKGILRRQDVVGFRPPPVHRPGSRPALDPSAFELVKLTRVRQTIAARMLESATSTPAFTLEVEVDMTRCIAVREELNTRGGEIRIAFHDIMARCLAVAARKHPLVNASYREDGIHVYQSVNVGLAVARDEGLVVPVIRDVGGKTLAAVARENASNVAAARDGTIQPGTLEGGTITLSNLGMFPVRRFTALINPPQSCIVALGAIAPRPVWSEGAWVARPTLVLTASFDHRVMDGAYGAAFLKDLQELLEAPAMLLL